MANTVNISTKCTEFLKPIVNGLGYRLVAVDWEKKQNGYNLTVYIDNGTGISLDDCEKVHKAIDEPLDQLNPSNDAPYTLNVSSCGLDWAFRSAEDYLSNIGNMVDVSLYAPINRKKNYTGVLTSYNEQNITITLQKDNSEVSLPVKSISKICKHIDF